MTCEYQIRVEVEDQEREIQVQPEAYNQASGGTIEITENGTYDVTKYQEAEVDVPVDASAAFNTNVYGDTNHGVSSWYKEALVNWDVLPLTEFIIDDSVNSVSNLFSGSGVKKVKITGGNNVTTIGAMMMGCKALTEFYLSDGAFPIAQNFGQFMIGCESIPSIDLSNWRPSGLNAMRYAFQNCESLRNANLGGWDTSKVTAFEQLFYMDRSLEAVNISGWSSESATRMSSMFYGCQSLKAIVIDSPSVFSITNTGVFSNSSVRNGGTGFVYVPDNLVDEYKSATNWTTVASQIKPLSELPQEVKDVFGM